MDLDRLDRWLGAQGFAGPSTAPVPLGGGTQNILLRFAKGDRQMVLRRPPIHLRKNSNETMRREARLLAALADSDVPHPRLIAACADEDVLGAAFYVMEPVDGFAPVTGLPELHGKDPAVRHAMGLAAVDGALALAAIDHIAVGLADFGNPEGFLARQVGRWLALLESYRAFSEWPGEVGLPGVRAVAQWLDAERPAAFQPGIMHGDFHIGNMMFRHDGPALAAIVDWELATIGDPLLDLGWMIATWPSPPGRDGPVAALRLETSTGFPTIGELIDHYAAHSSRDLSHIGWYAILACFKLAIVLEGSFARACAGKADVAIGADLHDASIRLLSRALDWIGTGIPK